MRNFCFHGYAAFFYAVLALSVVCFHRMTEQAPHLFTVLSTYKKMIDPLTTAVRISLLPYMPVGTKIGFVGDELVFFSPSLLGVIHRTLCSTIYGGCSRGDLFRLRYPIHAAYGLYGSTYPILFEYVLAGLKELCLLYPDGNVQETISLCINLKPLTVDDCSPAIKVWSDDELDTIVTLLTFLKKKEKDSNLMSCIDAFLRSKR